MYAAKGDPAAYELVRQHFDLLTEETLRHKGVVIKTIGDAVMASFLTDLDAAEAAIGYQKIIAQFNQNQELSEDNALILKVGVHSGPCLSVNLNSVMDYFGTTVNMAARIGALSKGNDIVTSAAILSNPAVRTTFEEGGFITGESMRVQLRGIPEETEVYRLSKTAN
jgi:class 3 adenylate cyclase